jgi:methyl-accepting chemotaxis protein
MLARLNLTVGRKLVLSFAVLGVVLAGALVAALSGMSSMSAQHHTVVEMAVPKQIAADAARASAADVHYSQTEYALDSGQSRSNYVDDRSTFRAALAKVAKLSTTTSDKQALAKVKAAAATFDGGDTKLLALVRAGDRAQVIKFVNGPENDASDALVGALTDYQQQAQRGVNTATSHFDSVNGSSRTVMLLVALFAALVGGALAWLLIRTITRAVRQVLSAAEGIAQGDLEQRVEVSSRDELGAMATAFETMIAYLRTMAAAADRIAGGDLSVEVQAKSPQDALGNAFATMVGNLRELVGSVAGSAATLSNASYEMAATSDEAGRAVGEIASAVSEVAQGAERQVRMVESTREAVQEATNAANSSAQAAAVTAEAVEGARRVARDGVQTAEQATEAIQQVAASSEQVGVAIGDLSKRSQQIGGIVETISGIAEQTNLLALNAAIEAARAGEQGRGFAVVAEEVRKLAEESQGAAGQIAELIGEIQSETAKVVHVVAESAKRTDDGVERVRHTRQAFEEIGRAVEDVTAHVGEIAAAVEQIAAGAQRAEGDISEVAGVAEESSASAEEVSASTEQTSASTQQIAASSQSLAKTADELNDLVGRFTLTA